MQNDFGPTLTNTAIYLKQSGKHDINDPSEMTPQEVEWVCKFLIDLKKLKLVRKPVQVTTGGHSSHGTGEFLSSRGEYLLDRRVIRVYPPDRVTAERMSDGGLRLTGVGLGENEFARVEVGYEAVLYIGNGEVVVLDGHGNVDEFTGRTFVERPLDPRAFRWEPVKDAADSSTIRTRLR